MARKTYAAAFVDGIYAAMRRDQALRLMGTGFGGRFEGRLTDAFKARIFDPPTSEGAMAALGTGAALTGMPMMVHFGTSAFMLEAWNQICHEAAVSHYMTSGEVDVPVTFHGFHGVRVAGAPQHSTSPQAMAANMPGLEVVLPASPHDVKGLILSALKSRNPTLFLNHTKLMGIEDEVPGRAYEVPFGKADIKRRGRDVTIVATSWMVQVSLEAAALLAEDGISAEVVDPRTAVPLDIKGICRSVRKTGRLVAVDETPEMCSIASEIAASVGHDAFAALKAPIERVCRAPAPTPFSPPLERFTVPSAETIAAAARKTLKLPRRRRGK
ncbi:MAG: transketolase C-terminal domain-containing protein [Alphaproteobacteria bacterium]|nr:transketolase C-terminal domain-containing protein [Alphaproteobacteria bacterium]